MDCSIVVKLLYDRDKLSLGNLRRQPNLARKHPRLGTGLLLCGDIADACRVLTHKDYSQSRRNALIGLQARNPVGNLFAQIGRKLFTVYYL